MWYEKHIFIIIKSYHCNRWSIYSYMYTNCDIIIMYHNFLICHDFQTEIHFYVVYRDEQYSHMYVANNRFHLHVSRGSIFEFHVFAFSRNSDPRFSFIRPFGKYQTRIVHLADRFNAETIFRYKYSRLC